jgi:NTE family protein
MTASTSRTTARRHALLFVAALAAAVVGCAPLNPQLARYDPEAGYRFTALADAEAPQSDETFIVLTFSGGGTRAAAFAYGVLSELRDTPLGNGRSLLDEVDLISSVSGGSFAAAYYGLFDQSKFFRDFPDEVLYRKIERDLLLRVLAPWNWVRLLSPRFSRADLADAYYDARIFDRRRFAGLPRKRPFIILNATDIGRGAQFSFTQEHFDRVCSDLDGVRVSSGVTASSAFPVAFTPITLKNHGPDACGYRAPEWVELAEHGDFQAAPQRYDLARTWRSYEDAAARRFIHLSDGGLSDNIGLRAVENAMIFTGSIGLYDKVNNGTVKRVAVIAVDAKPHVPASYERHARPPGIFTVLEAAATNPMENYSSDTVERIRLWFREWDRAARNHAAREAGCESFAATLCHASRDTDCEVQQRARCLEHLQWRGGLPHPELYLIHVRFDAIGDEHAKRKLQGVATRLQLPRGEVDLLIEWARRLLRESGRYRALVQALRAEAGS